jgi:aminopeptidase N
MRRTVFLCAALLAGCASQVGERQDSIDIAREPAPIAAAQAPDASEYPQPFDALHYSIRLTLLSTGSRITGSTDIRLAVGAPRADTMVLDFTGLQITGVEVDGVRTQARHENGKLFVPVPAGVSSGQELRVRVDYAGTPDDGLIIRKNVHGTLAVFADNWPNRARFWFPAIDHPADKATASFTVVAPADWLVVANGHLVETGDAEASTAGTTEVSAGRRRWTWDILEPISTYNMVVGAATFDRHVVGSVCVTAQRCIEVTTYLFPEDRVKAAPSFRRAVQMIEYYSGLVAPFPYGKLAHVQSFTRFGGMENATAIFYSEQSIAQGGDIEGTVAHETAHQWFGNAVTPADWSHLWLSEGFASYFGMLFFEHADGVEQLRQRLERDRLQIVRSSVVARPIVDASETDLFTLINVNNYEKAAWVLHMLRGLVGDQAFFNGIRDYYRRYEHRTAATTDFRRAIEQAAGRELAWFFDQWLFRPGFPRLRVTSRWNAGERIATITVEQTQRSSWPTFRLPLTMEVDIDGSIEQRTLDMDERRETFRIPAAVAPRRVTVDPDGWVLKDVESEPRTREGAATRP